MSNPLPTVYVETYGCQMNVSDSELMLGKLADSGYATVDRPDDADVILVNTCAIREHAEQRVIGRLGELKSKMRPDSILGVTGCMAQRMGTELLDRVKHLSLVIGPDGYRDLGTLVDNARNGERASVLEFDLDEHYEDFQPRRFDNVKAWIPVQRGCDYNCTYCIVPYTRGPERSRKLADVVRETEVVVSEGMTEVILLGQTVNSFNDGEHDFADLLRAVGKVPGLNRLRFTSPHPNDFSDRVIRAMAETDTVCEHVHLPMQSGSDRVLKRMHRRYTSAGYLECVDKLRSAIPGLSFTTDVIVGFPGETEEDFESTLSVVRQVGFQDAFTFKFSPRAGTPATRFPESQSIADDVASDRLGRLISTVREGTRQRNNALLGTRHEVLVEKPARRGGLLQARTRDFKTVIVPGDPTLIGKYLNVELTGTTGSTFTAKLVSGRLALPLAG
ncbi:MAG: tRNA (N6-isopentenyl adenosine(37)-C2)-methylthiotransferase MiaB [Gemmatimonadaceae bacterium]|nr:tRNA (N6-isopentenyl adenosine(37)-C2)-methylthiotransferase MiaB [Gemmatimonadaceae bacterium]